MNGTSELSKYDRARRWLANARLNLPVIGVVKYGGAAAGLLGPLAVGVVTWNAQMGLGASVVYFVALRASFVGPVLNQGASEVEQTNRKRLAHEHSFDLTAAISLLREVQEGRFDRERFQHQILKEIASTVDTVVHVEGAKILACLLVPEGEHLELVAWSDHREGRIPSASIPLATEVGSALTHRTGKTQHIPDVRAVEGEEFNGKSYRAVLTFPMLENGEVIGVVAVDSTEPHHFDKWLLDLDVHVRPFVGLLAFSVVEPQSGA